MKIILTEKIAKLGTIGDTVEVATGYARNYLLPKGKALRWSRENLAVFESKKAELVARQDAAKSKAESQVDAVKNVKFHMIRQAGDTGHLYGSVSSRDIARLLADAGIHVESHQVLLGNPIKTIGAFDTKIALHPDVIVPVKVYVAQTADEIDALVAGKILTFGTKKAEEEGEPKAEGEDKTAAPAVEQPAESDGTDKKPARKKAAKAAESDETAKEPAAEKKPRAKKKTETEE
ncbi:MAG: 50S ribosomal protein L9 [Proteobacteria bacterium]|nr:50S ribosomal protein L9 [Pseudomonadota bacterium]